MCTTQWLILLLLFLMVPFLFSCQPHEDYYATATGYRVYHVDDGIPIDLALVVLDTGANEWCLERGQVPARLKDVRFNIHWSGGSWITYAEGNIWLDWGEEGNYLPALWHELDHVIYGSYHGY